MSGLEIDVKVDLSNGLLEADARLSLASVGRECRRRGLWFPLARPLPGFSLAEACARLPTFLDAFVAQVDGLVEGQPVSTPRAPRAAVGPDLLGALALGTPLARASRVRVRVFDMTRTSSLVEEHETSLAAAARVVALIEEGRAFALDAHRIGGRVLLHVLGATGASSSTSAVSQPFAHASSLRVRSGVSLAPGDVDAMARFLDDGARVVAAPFMGRAGALVAARRHTACLPLEEGCARLARALVMTGAQPEEKMAHDR